MKNECPSAYISAVKSPYSLSSTSPSLVRSAIVSTGNVRTVKKTISEIYKSTGYVIDTHTAVAASVGKAYLEENKDERKTVIASTASPYKFARSVMTSIDEKYDTLEEFDLIVELEKISCVKIPKAIEEIRDAKIVHTRECDADKMENTVKDILGV